MSAAWKTASAHAVRHRKKENTSLEKLIRFSPEKLLISRGSFSPLSTLTLARFSFALPFSVSSFFPLANNDETKRNDIRQRTKLLTRSQVARKLQLVRLENAGIDRSDSRSSPSVFNDRERGLWTTRKPKFRV